MSHPARGAWIEISRSSAPSTAFSSHPARGAWIEMPMWETISQRTMSTSHPARGAWIEIFAYCAKDGDLDVAPRKGCVD